MNAKASKQACDNCRRRKIKCSRELPCDKCQRLLLSCSYGDVLRRKGPKFRTLYPLAALHPSRANSEKDQDPETDFNSPISPFGGQDARFHFSDTFSHLPPPDLVSSPGTDSTVESANGYIHVPRRLPPQILLAHVNVYLKYLFPIMPVVRGDQLRSDCDQPERLSAKRYAFLASLCAATHIQLKLDGATPVSDPALRMGDGHLLMSGEELLAEAVRARGECDILEDLSTENLLTSFFLFASYGNMDRQSHAWFFLCQATSFAFSLGLHRESTYAEYEVEEAEERRRVFWLLFITERGYALQQAKPVMLRSSIHKPQVLCSGDPILAYGFISLINIFEKLTPNLYDWVSAGGGDSILERPPTSAIQSSLCKAISLDGVLEIQQVDILITQQWLQAMMWKLSMNHATQPGSRDDSVLPFHLPVMVGKAVMGVIGTASQGAVDAHGIGMVSSPGESVQASAELHVQEQKLFDMGISVADVTRSLGPKAVTRLAESTIDPNELLWGILHTLSQIRGSPSYLFPTLLERCKTVLGLDCSITTGNFLPILGATAPEQLASWSGQNFWDESAGAEDMEVHDGNEQTEAGPHPVGQELDFQSCLLGSLS
ncbi:unnamed protein product [Penicillium salamii]|uniref:Zn(2)-C6 fungal-type domain-containing protein n=1 Tax=Penicillium salamii TaxID=1612424 RepID=A0A9W4JWB5_9EURO|nr:unnamed protein product [Penicillium salamii]CAG8332116.1 unnamed protein product [Penicillium salamii]CAG8359671.1 unnamed protein product [Penicillium salamii]CAG8372074.1 unnamed protein product [Penicillium salamii]CAG8412274.1 unnamed protein product [Penicillium salamii]